jgi:hypothetical protein
MHGRAALGSTIAGLGLLAACGGKVIWTPNGSDGGAGSTSTGSSTGTVMTGKVSSSASGASNACEKYCSVPGCTANDPGCLTACEQLYTTGCEQLADAYVTCLAESIEPPDCSAGAPCAGAFTAYGKCGVGSSCSPTSLCSQGGNTCGCTGECFGQKVGTACTATPTGFSCDCLVNGATVGSCVGIEGTFCNLANNCCAQFFKGVD